VNATAKLSAGEERTGRASYARATTSDDAALRGLLSETPMAGAVRLGFRREPDYFAGENLLGGADHTILARQRGRVLCMGRCSRRTVWWNGEPRRVGYLGELRLASDATGAGEILREGYRFFRELEAEDPAEIYFSSIAADNQRGRRVLEAGHRLGLPRYRWLAELVTAAVPVPRESRGAGVGIGATRAELTDVLNRHGRSGQLGLIWDSTGWEALARHGLTERDFLVVRRAGKVVASGAIWDQRAFRQTVIHGYSGALRWARPAVNALAALRGRPGWPRAGEVLAQASVLGLAWENAAALRQLWPALCERATAGGLGWLVVTGDGGDGRWREALGIIGGREYRTRLYTVSWRDFPTTELAPDGRSFCPEVSLL